MDDLVAPAFVGHLPGRAPLDRAGYAAALADLYAAFPDLQHVVEDVVAEGERVAARLTERGTHQGPFGGIAPTGRIVTMTAIGIHRVAGGRLAELWLVADALGRLRQLGATVHPPAAPEPPASG